MAKISGLGMAVTVEDSGAVARDITNDIMTMGSNQSRNLIDVTGIDVDAFERLSGLRDFDLQLTGEFNPAANKSHDVFKDLDNIREVVITYPGAVALCTLSVALESYNIAREAGGALKWTVAGKCAGGSVVWT